jgi:hypothetical protein
MSKGPSSRLLRIPVTFVDGKWEFKLGGEVPIKEGSGAELVIRRSSISKSDFLEMMEKKDKFKVLNEGTCLLVSLTVKSETPPLDVLKPLLQPYEKVSEILADGFFDNRGSVAPSFVAVTIAGPDKKQSRLLNTERGGLWLLTQGMEAIGLGSTTIKLPQDISVTPVSSLNHAYTALSEAFEPWRISHTGNIYSRILYKEHNDKWYPLETLRNNELRKAEQVIASKLWGSFLQRMNPVKPTDL